MTLYYITGYVHSSNEWWRFAVSAPSSEEAVVKFVDGYSDIRFSRVSAKAICPVTTDVFEEL